MLRLVWIVLFGLSCSAAAGCSEDEKRPGRAPVRNDAGAEDAGPDPLLDAGGLLPGVPFDAGRPTPGEPPPDLAGEQCAVDTNKLFDLATLDRAAAPVQLAVDPIESRFGVAFVGDSEVCTDAVYLATVQGPSGVGEPEIDLVSDECTLVLYSTIARVGDRWLVAAVDARMEMYDLWVQPHGAGGDPVRLSETLARETEVAITAVDLDPDPDARSWAALVAWVEKDETTQVSRLIARSVSEAGEPLGDAVVLEESDTWSYASLSAGRLEDGLAALAYRRFDTTGQAEIVLDVLDAESAERQADTWLLTAEAGPYGGAELATNQDGGAVIYSLGQAQSSQIWFQRLDKLGGPARIMNGTSVGGPAEPQRVVAPPSNAIDASMTRLPNGYAVLYRALPGLTLDAPRIRVHFLDVEGRSIAESDVALATEFGGRTAIEAGFDGRISLAWTDQHEDGTSTVTVAKLPCVGGG